MPEAIQSVPIWMMLLGFLLMLGPLVTLHELGHYLVGRWCGVRAEVFSVGFGSELVGWTDKRGTRWQIAALPLGGFVKFAGDMSPASEPSDEYLALPPEEQAQCFQSKTLWQKALIVAAGPVTNLVIAIAIFAGFAMAYGIPTTPPVIEYMPEESAAREAGLEVGDTITAIDGAAVENFDDVSDMILPFPGQQITMEYERDGVPAEVTVQIADQEFVDRFGNRSRIGLIGVGSYSREWVPAGPLTATAFGVTETGDMLSLIVTGIRQIVMGERSIKELGGPITMAKVSGERLSLGWTEFVYFVAFVSINLAFINLLPIPVLDGGHLAFYAVEAIRRKPLSHRSQEFAFRTGLAFVLSLMLFVTLIDIAKLPIFGS